MGAQAKRFRDPTSASSLYALAVQPIDVVCPRCSAHARVIAEPGDSQVSTIRPRRLVCLECGQTRTWSPRSGSSWWGTAVDPFFRQPLWLTATARGHRLWAYNREHLALLAQYAAAELRERGPGGGCSMSMIETLPAWMKSAGNRAGLLSAMARLEARVDDPGRSRTRSRQPARSVDLRRTGAIEHCYHFLTSASPGTQP
jgi:hypothetical protein